MSHISVTTTCMCLFFFMFLFILCGLEEDGGLLNQSNMLKNDIPELFYMQKSFGKTNIDKLIWHKLTVIDTGNLRL